MSGSHTCMCMSGKHSPFVHSDTKIECKVICMTWQSSGLLTIIIASGVEMVGPYSPVNTYTYEPNWAPNAI